MKEYAFKEGSRLSGDVEKVGRRLEVLHRRYGHLTPDIVVDDASSQRSPLHQYIWKESNTEAAHQRRIALAEHLIRSITVVIESESEPKSIRAFVVIEKKGEAQYIDTEVALSDQEMRRQVLSRALSELNALRRKYADLKELASVFAAIDKLKIHTPKRMGGKR